MMSHVQDVEDTFMNKDKTQCGSDVFLIRKMEEKDLDEIVLFEKKYFGDPWCKEAFESLFEKEMYCAVVICCIDKVVGYGCCACAGDEAEIYNICVAEEFRRKGLAGRIMDEMESFSLERGASDVYLEVRESNESAILLYLSRGFVKLGSRKNYYSNPKENAILMKKEICRIN